MALMKSLPCPPLANKLSGLTVVWGPVPRPGWPGVRHPAPAVTSHTCRTHGWSPCLSLPTRPGYPGCGHYCSPWRPKDLDRARAAVVISGPRHRRKHHLRTSEQSSYSGYFCGCQPDKPTASLVATSRITLQYLWSLCCWLCYSRTLYCIVFCWYWYWYWNWNWNWCWCWYYHDHHHHHHYHYHHHHYYNYWVLMGLPEISRTTFRGMRHIKTWWGHDTCKYFMLYWPFVRGIHRVTGHGLASNLWRRRHIVPHTMMSTQWINSFSTLYEYN